jgi:hypothetical protein
MIFDNSKIKAAVPEFNCKIQFSEGVKEVANWYKNEKTPENINLEADQVFDRMIKIFLTLNKSSDATINNTPCL